MGFAHRSQVERKQSKKKKVKWGWWILLILLVIGSFLVFKVFGPNTGSFRDGQYLYIPTGSSYENVKQLLQNEGFIKDIRAFDLLANKAGYPEKVRPGKYHVKPGMSNYDLVRMLRSGRQTSVKLVINKLRTKKDFIRLLSNNLEADSNVLNRMFNDPVYLAQFGLDTNTIMGAVLPDTYEFWWNTDADKAFRKIERYYAAYWDDTRRQLARDRDLSPMQAVTMASIIEEETNNNNEKPNIASVYLNRLQQGMKLQADPTTKFAVGDFTIRRINSTHTALASPYNTYYTTGLPPGPICTPSKKSIEAVLHSPKTNYLYFCAKEDFSGSHRFASTYAEHEKNAALYQKALNARGIH